MTRIVTTLMAVILLSTIGLGQAAKSMSSKKFSSSSYSSYDRTFENPSLTKEELRGFEAKAKQHLKDFFLYVQQLPDFDSVPAYQEALVKEVKAMTTGTGSLCIDELHGARPTIEFVDSLPAQPQMNYEVEIFTASKNARFRSFPDGGYYMDWKVLLNSSDQPVRLSATTRLIQTTVQFDHQQKKVWKVYISDLECTPAN